MPRPSGPVEWRRPTISAPRFGGPLDADTDLLVSRFHSETSPPFRCVGFHWLMLGVRDLSPSLTEPVLMESILDGENEFSGQNMVFCCCCCCFDRR